MLRRTRLWCALCVYSLVPQTQGANFYSATRYAQSMINLITVGVTIANLLPDYYLHVPMLMLTEEARERRKVLSFVRTILQHFHVRIEHV